MQRDEIIEMATRLGITVELASHPAVSQLINEVTKLVAAKAWEEGYQKGVEDERISKDNIGIAGFGMKVQPDRQNPYAIRARGEA